MKILVLGGGLAGLATALHLPGRGVTVLEREEEPGGVARTRAVGGFHFDLAGHLLHLRDPEIRGLVEGLLPGVFRKIARKAFVFSNGVYTPYPFQANTHGLPPEVVRDCLLGFIAVAVREDRRSPDDSFRDWALATFGEGICRHFMFPFNEKLLRTDLAEVTTDWVSWSVPRPSLEEVVSGSLGIANPAFGYNPEFLYPRRGGIRVLADRLAREVPGLVLGAEVVGVDAAERTVRLADGTAHSWDRLVSTIPLPVLLGLTSGVPEELRECRRWLRHVDVWVWNLGVRGEAPHPAHWIYVPEPRFPFYRVGIPTNFSDGVAPAGHYSLYVETSRRPEEPVDEVHLQRELLEGLVAAGLVRDPADISAADLVAIRPAYVIHDRWRREGVPWILGGLRRHGILSIGRWGAWTYSSMEDALRDGRSAAAELQAEGA